MDDEQPRKLPDGDDLKRASRVVLPYEEETQWRADVHGDRRGVEEHVACPGTPDAMSSGRLGESDEIIVQQKGDVKGLHPVSVRESRHRRWRPSTGRAGRPTEHAP